jgi:hypothetical protein
MKQAEQPTYEPPLLSVLGTLAELTQGSGGTGVDFIHMATQD